ncbi:MAG: ATP-binding protein [Oligoflexales bacterium]|nr:ATP-binding protein [Oligoflexales bacterium]
MSVEIVSEQLRQLKMHQAALDLPDSLAKIKKAVSLDWLIEVLQNEIDSRKAKRLESRIKQACFPERTSLEEFDWDFNPDIDRIRIESIASLNFIREKRIVLFLGKTGTGKTHLALAIGLRAIAQEYKVFCSSMKRLAEKIEISKRMGRLDLLFKRMLSKDLWILDDWGVVSMTREIAEEVFDLLDRRKNSCSLILTSNRDVPEWGRIFPEPVLASAAIDRLFDHAEIVCFRGKSYRLSGRITMDGLDSFKFLD